METIVDREEVQRITKDGPAWDPLSTSHMMDHRYKLPGCRICQTAKLKFAPRRRGKDLGKRPQEWGTEVTGDHMFDKIDNQEFDIKAFNKYKC